MAGQPGFFDLSDRYEALSAAGDARLVVHRPSATAAEPVDDLDAAHRPRRLKRKVKCRFRDHPGLYSEMKPAIIPR